MAAFKSVVINGKNGDVEKSEQKKLGLEVSKVELQKLFIDLTNKGGIKQWKVINLLNTILKVVLNLY